MNQNLDSLCVTTLRMLAADMVEQAQSGHPGMPLGAAPMAYALWSRILRHNPHDPTWLNRDRFILSAGHGSALLYALLHLSGYDLPLEELKNFRQWGSRTPGHPEYGLTAGVETSTGPLGQGIAMGVGMAMAERQLAEGFNSAQGLPVVDHHVYVIVSDGDLMEGVASEAASLAGHLRLGKLIVLYDDNRISIEGSTDLAFTEDVEARFRAYGWHTLTVIDGEDLDAIEAALRAGQAVSTQPTLIRVRTQIGFGTPLVNTASVHGSPLGPARMAATRTFFDWPSESFHVPQAALDRFQQVARHNQALHQEWEERVASMEQGETFKARLAGVLPAGWDQELLALTFNKPIATRAASGVAINAMTVALPALTGGSADLAPSNNTHMQQGGTRNIHFGVREHAMAAVVNGMALHGGIIPYCATFLVFSDYMRGAMRLSALMETRVIYILTHDSVAVGEDGPTHQPIEQMAGLRALPGLTLIRPADAYETVAAWRWAIMASGPTALILSRQNLPVLSPDPDVAKGAYVVSACQGVPDMLLLATGSEVHLALAVKEELVKLGHQIQVVSMPSWELFESQSVVYREQVLPSKVRIRLAMEAGASLGWHRWVGEGGDVVAVDRFGASAPGQRVMQELGFDVASVTQRALRLLTGERA